MAVEEGWPRRIPYVDLDRAAIARLLGAAVVESELLSGGLRNTNYRVRLHQGTQVVLRLYTADASACAREVALMQLVRGRVPVQGVLQSTPEADPPWAVFEWLPGERFDHMLACATRPEVEQACRSAGQALAHIHRFRFPGPGFLGPALEIREPMGYPWLTGVGEFFAGKRAAQLVGPELAEDVVQLVEREGWRLDGVWTQAALMHADYKPWNLLVQQEHAGWQVSAVLDWEFALAAPPLGDFGIFLRYSERMPPEYTSGFLDGYRVAGGDVPPDARNLARLIDLVSLWTFLDRPPADPAIVRDVVPLLVSTVQAFAR